MVSAEASLRTTPLAPAIHLGADRVLECVGTKESMDQALRSARPGGMVSFVGVPNGGPELPLRRMFDTNVGARGGVAPVRGYIEARSPENYAETAAEKPAPADDAHA